MSRRRRLLGTAIALLSVLGGVYLLYAVRGQPGDSGAAFVAPSATASARSPTTPSPGASTRSATASPRPKPTATTNLAAPSGEPAEPAAEATAQGGGAAAPERPGVTVLNNSIIRGLGRRVAGRLQTGGWEVVEVGNLRGRTPYTTVYYAPGQQDAARALAQQFGVDQVESRYDGLPGQGLTIVVTKDFA